MRASLVFGVSAIATALTTGRVETRDDSVDASATVSVSSKKRLDCYQSNDIVGTWILTSANQTYNGQVSQPFGANPHGFLFNTGSPDLSWIEEVAPTDPDHSSQPAQSSAGYYKIDKQGNYLGRGIVSSTIASNIGNYSPNTVLDLQLYDSNTLVEQFYPVPGAHIVAVWTRWVPGTTTYPANQ